MRINWQKVVIFLSVVYVICIIFQATVTIKQLTGKAVSSEGEVSLTITGTTPTISNIDPDGSQYINTPNVTISFTTDQTSNCSYSQTETEYDDMTRISDSIEATGHNFTITNLINKQYTYNFKCIDTQDEESALNILIFTTSLTNRTDNNLLINETDFTILNYTGQTRKIEQNITQHTQTQITTNIQIPILNETHQLTLQIEGNKTREFISTEDYTIISPATANIQRAIYGGDDKSLITRISESDSNYYNQEQSITIVTNSTKQYTVDLYVRDSYTRDFAIIQDTYLLCSPLTGEVLNFNKTSSDTFECNIKENNNEFQDVTQPIVYKTNTNADFNFNLSFDGTPKEIEGIISQYLIAVLDNAQIYNMEYTAATSQLDFTADGDGNQSSLIYVHNKGLPTSVKFDNIEMESTEWSYNSVTKIVSINVSLGSAHNITVSWYSAPTPTTEEAAGLAGGGAGGGGGAGELSVKKYFTIDPKIIKLMLKQGQSLKRTVKIKNTGTTVLKLEIEHELHEILSVSETQFSLDPNQEKEIEFYFFTTEQTIPNVYTDEIIIKANGIQEKISTIVEVESERKFFDISLDIVADYRRVKPGEELLAQITLFNLYNIGETDVEMFYYIKDKDGNIITQLQETVTVDEQASFTRTFRIPSDTQEKDYILIVQTRYDGSVGTASELFEVSTQREIPGTIIPEIIQKLSIINIIFLIILTIIVISILYLFMKHQKTKLKRIKKQSKKLKTIKTKVKNEKNKTKLKIQKQKLRNQLDSIEKAHKLKYISNSTYYKSKSKINNMLKQINKKIKK